MITMIKAKQNKLMRLSKVLSAITDNFTSRNSGHFIVLLEIIITTRGFTIC